MSLQGNELVEEGDGKGQSTLFLLSREHALHSSDLKQKIESGVGYFNHRGKIVAM